jgi:hypothetical protein
MNNWKRILKTAISYRQAAENHKRQGRATAERENVAKARKFEKQASEELRRYLKETYIQKLRDAGLSEDNAKKDVIYNKIKGDIMARIENGEKHIKREQDENRKYKFLLAYYNLHDALAAVNNLIEKNKGESKK